MTVDQIKEDGFEVLLALGEGCGAPRYRFRLSPLVQWEIVRGNRYCEVV